VAADGSICDRAIRFCCSKLRRGSPGETRYFDSMVLLEFKPDHYVSAISRIVRTVYASRFGFSFHGILALSFSLVWNSHARPTGMSPHESWKVPFNVTMPLLS